MQNQPLVTVYIPTFNRLELLKRAVKSVQDQTYQNLEIIIVDDCSTDATYEYLEQLAKEDNRVRYFLKEKNSGACVSRNIAIENAKGEFITGLDDDDYFKTHRIKDFVERANIEKNDVILFSNYIEKNYDVEKSTILKKKKVTFKDLLINNHVGNQIFIRVDIMKIIGGFDEELEIWQDLDLWIRLSQKYEFSYVDNYSYVIDVTGDIVRITNTKIDKMKNSYLKIVYKNNLNANDAILLKNHFLYYNYKDIRMLELIKMFFLRPSFLVVKTIVKRLFL